MSDFIDDPSPCLSGFFAKRRQSPIRLIGAGGDVDLSQAADRRADFRQLQDPASINLIAVKVQVGAMTSSTKTNNGSTCKDGRPVRDAHRLRHMYPLLYKNSVIRPEMLLTQPFDLQREN